jgi:hypothetical protein
MDGDYLLNEDFSPVIENGDFVVGNNSLMQQKKLLLAQKGEFREFPTLGVGLADFLESDTTEGLEGTIRQEFENDGLRVRKLKVYDDFTVDIEATRR